MITFIFGWKQTQVSRIKSTGKHKIHREAQSPSRSIKSIAISGRMPTVSRIAILCIPILLLMVILQFDLLLLREHSLVPLIPTLRTSHPEVTLSDPGGPLLVSMAEVVMLPPHVLPQPTCSPPPLPRLKSFSSKNFFWKPKSFFFNSLQIPKLLWISGSDWPTSLFPTIRRHDDAFRV